MNGKKSFKNNSDPKFIKLEKKTRNHRFNIVKLCLKF